LNVSHLIPQSTCLFHHLVALLDLDHTADVQLHSWGDTLIEAFEQNGMAMFGYMTEIETVDIKEKHEIEYQADDLDGLLYHFLDELLFLFSAEPFLICKKLKITELNLETFSIKCSCYGEAFDLAKHPQGTEVKAITYSAMSIVQNPEEKKVDIFVIIDI
jgi:SHS2 domain-containing protein